MTDKVYRNFTQEQVDTIIDLSKQKISSRKICRELGLPESTKSSVNCLLVEWREGNVQHSGDISYTEEEVVTEDLSEEDLDLLCEHPVWETSNLAKRLRAAQRSNNQLRKIQREVFDCTSVGKETLEKVFDTLSDRMYGNYLRATTNIEVPIESENKIVEILFSDLQIGKCSQYYNTGVAKRALQYYGKEVLKIVDRTKPEAIVFASLGDIVEDHLKHGVQSAVSTDTGLAEQLADAIEEVWWSVLSPLFSLGIPVYFVGVAGNHGASQHKGMDMYKAGRYCYDYTIYKTWETMCKVAGYDNVTFTLPEGCFATVDIYGQKYLYEHGYNNQVGEKQMEDHKKKRQENLKTYIHGYRQGDKHHSVQYDNSNLMCNGAFFGIEQEGGEYSGILGFNSIPTQAVVVHEPITGQGQSTITEVVQIQIAKGY